jgi:hypothetical protein
VKEENVGTMAVEEAVEPALEGRYAPQRENVSFLLLCAETESATQMKVVVTAPLIVESAVETEPANQNTMKIVTPVPLTADAKMMRYVLSKPAANQTARIKSAVMTAAEEAAEPAQEERNVPQKENVNQKN